MFFAFTIKAQVNLVPNPSFEDTVDIRSIYISQLDNALSWYSAHAATPDYWNYHYGTASSSPNSNDTLARTGVSFAAIVTSAYTTMTN